MNFMFANVAVDFFVRGGLVMWPILAALLAALVIIIERSLWWLSLSRRSNSEKLAESFAAISDGDYERAIRLTDHNTDPFLQTVHHGLTHAHSSLLGAM